MSGHDRWHVDDGLAARYAGGTATADAAASVEAHMSGCAACRDRLAAIALPAGEQRLASVWADVVDRLDTPAPGLLERLLRRAGFHDGDARLVATAPAFRLAWVLSVATVLGLCVAIASRPTHGPDLFLFLAPVLPVLAVGLAYGPWVDPSYETTQAAPYSTLRLVLLRTGLVLVVTGGLVLVAAIAVPDRGLAVLWLIPSTALVAVTLAASAWASPVVAAGTVTAVWWVALVAVWWDAGSLRPAFGPTGQVIALVLLLLAVLVVLVARRAQAYDLRRYL